MNRGSVSINVTAVNPCEEENPDVAVEALEPRPELENRKYTYDYGIRKSHDVEGSNMIDARQFNQPQNVTVTLRLPLEYRKVINYVEIKVEQSSEEHECKIIDGGIGQSFIELEVTAKNTYWFNYDARFYTSGRSY